MTTNHPELLDPALIRCGRCDMKVPFGNASKKQIRGLFLKMYTHHRTDKPRSVTPKRYLAWQTARRRLSRRVCLRPPNCSNICSCTALTLKEPSRPPLTWSRQRRIATSRLQLHNSRMPTSSKLSALLRTRRIIGVARRRPKNGDAEVGTVEGEESIAEGGGGHSGRGGWT